MRVTRSSAVRRSASEAVARASRAAFAARSASVGDRHALDVHVGRRQQGGPDRGPGGEPVDLRLLGRVVGRLLAQGALRGGEQGVGAGRERRPPDGDVVPEPRHPRREDHLGAALDSAPCDHGAADEVADGRVVGEQGPGHGTRIPRARRPGAVGVGWGGTDLS